MEFENALQRCSWVQVYDDGVKAVLVEDSIVWANRSDVTAPAGAPASATAWPALVSPQLDSGRKSESCIQVKWLCLEGNLGMKEIKETC